MDDDIPPPSGLPAPALKSAPRRASWLRAVNDRFSIAASVKLALITSCCHRFALRLPRPTGLLLLFEVGAKPPHDGMRRMGRYNLSDALAADRRQDRRTLRTHPTRRPREDIFLPKQNGYLLDGGFPPSPRRLQATAGTAVLSFLLHRNSLPSTHIRCRTTARRLATATIARRIPRRWATRTPHAFSHDHFLLWVSSECAAS